MKRIAILLFFISVVFSSAFAAIGDTPEQCLERYGQFIKTCPDGSNVYKSKELGLDLVAWFDNGRVNKIMYQKISGSDGSDPGFSDNEVKHLLEINGGGRTWEDQHDNESGKTMWSTADNELNAVYDKSSPPESLVIFPSHK